MDEDRELAGRIAELAERVVRENSEAGRRVAVAESCTGGLVSAALTAVPGASRVFDRGFVTYSNEAKMQALGVPRDLIETFGAVSIAVAWAMARGALERSEADVTVAITGVAGPDGGTPAKPVGTVVFSRAHRAGQTEPEGERRDFGERSRETIRNQAVMWALELLLP